MADLSVARDREHPSRVVFDPLPRRISRRYTSLGYSDYFYVDGTDWLLRETWHSYIAPYNVFDLIRYWYTNGRPIRMELEYGNPVDLSFPVYYETLYLVYNWHGDVDYVGLEGIGAGGVNYPPWGDADGARRGAPWDYYRWNTAWGYMTFTDLGLYYVHGRWYDPWIGRFISPDEKGEYLYGSGDDAVNYAWIAEQAIALGKTSPAARQIVLNGGQFIVETSEAAQCAIYQPEGSNVLWCATRATVPAVLVAAPIAYGGSYLITPGVTYVRTQAANLGRTLLGRTITGGATACTADQKDCANAITTITNWAPQGGRIMLGRFNDMPRLLQLAQQNAARILDKPYPINEAEGRDLAYFLHAEIDAASQIYMRMKDVVPGKISYDIEYLYIISNPALRAKTVFIGE